MEKRIVTDLSSEPVSLNSIKQYIKFAYGSDADEESLLSDMLSGVRTHIEQKTGLVFAKKTFEIRFYFDDGWEIHTDRVTMNATQLGFVLPVFPVLSVTEVKRIDLDDDSDTLDLNSDYYSKGKYERTIIYPLGVTQELIVKCTAGYDESDSETLPADIKEAIKKQVGRWYWHRDDYIEGKHIPEVNNIINKYMR